ncbi:intermembrane phospholipid transport protein YdbH family protein [Marinobacter zhanjiangensis]|uniref:Dicarboxylate transport n=1 Tax=Marinobacter zhanjiangensis TaxID=578215 RepID=A0ABQ3AQN5_9GAMM|nr:YdbH domain-containing protein [Marinobacter zhanjiangensis]GGY62345.1 hypothetical protein GCM10007071_06540 [Marinobacter zhanjiangensis]
MAIRRSLRVLLIVLLLLAGALWGGWSLVHARLAELGIEQVRFSGPDLGWSRLGFRSVSLTWTGDGRSLSVETDNPRLTLDWLDWQLDQLVAGQTRITHASTVDAAQLSSPPPSPGGGNALELTLPESMPFWLPRHLEIESLQASFPCQGMQCRFQGHVRFDRQAESATARVDATLTREQKTLAIRGNVRLGSGADPQSVTDGELQISGIRPWLPQALAADLRRSMPAGATVRFSPGGEPAPGQWPIRVELTTEGGAQPAFKGRVILHTGDPWRLDITQGQITATLERWQQAGWLFNTLQADLPIRGTVTANESRLTFSQGAAVSVRHMDAFGPEQLMWLDQVALSPGGTTVLYRDGQFQVNGPVALSAGEVRYPGLVTQAWQAEADVQWQQALTAEGELTNAAGASLPFRVDVHPAGSLDARLSMQLTPDNEANHLAATVDAWPETLALESGQVEAEATLRLPQGGQPEIFADVTFDEASGLYQTMAWQTLTGTVQGQWRDGELVASTDALELAQLNPGIPIGPIRVSASYRAETDAPARGTVHLENASAGFAEGTLSVADGTSWDLSEESWRIPVDARGVKLSALMNLYPTEGLAGEGTLEGQLPVIVGPGGVRIEDGRISALPPGGRLQLPADKLGGMAQSNQAMALVARAMENFHYRLLESGINYAEDGTLLLDLKLRGSSPGVDSDRPVVLNINLQEDIPALLTSLQLSGRVNDAVTERVRERFQQNRVETQ